MGCGCKVKRIMERQVFGLFVRGIYNFTTPLSTKLYVLHGVGYKAQYQSHLGDADG
jgi:hypothetical protein